MPRPAPPPQQALRPLAARKRNAAERREREAARLRQEAAVLEWQWTVYLAQTAAAKHEQKQAS
jgi:hypothetical protein